MMMWEELDEEQKKNCYDSYVGDMQYEWGDNAKIMSYEEWCRESAEFGQALF